MNVKFISITPDAEKTMAYIARVSNPQNQDNEKFAGLLRYCIKHGHWSVFEQSHMTVEIETTRGLAAQILRHRSFTYQEFSQRYADVSHIREDIPSIDDVDPAIVEKYNKKMRAQFDASIDLYKSMLHDGIAKECARFVLPLATPTRLYMTGSCRSWIHYINLRSAHGTQKEHMDLVEEIRKVFVHRFPTVSEALEWKLK